MNLLKYDLLKSISKNTTGIYRVSIFNRGKYKYFKYQYKEDGKYKTITNKDLDKLKEKVLERGLPWIILKNSNNYPWSHR